MNQIISNQFLLQQPEKKNIKKFKIVFWICIFIIIICIFILIYLKYNFSEKQKITKNLESKFELQNLYNNNSTKYYAQKLSTNKDPFVIGLLQIDSINLMYPILSTTSDELLKISPCRFFGPMPNEIGNMCIAGHNYANQTHFAKLRNLHEGDVIKIYDLSGNKIDYLVYTISELSANDTSCLNQNTNFSREITLVTCNTVKGNRIVIKAKETAI